MSSRDLSAGRPLLRVEARNSEVPNVTKPEWIKVRQRIGPGFKQLSELVRSQDLNTVCQEAGCPNIYECWEAREATFLIGGDRCTRRCDFCLIDTGKPLALDLEEPSRVALAIKNMELLFATVTGVARDDQPDGGAWLYAETVREIRRISPETGVEILIPDFNGERDPLVEVFSSRPQVLAHNLETVPRVFRRIRPGFDYERSLGVLSAARHAGLIVKSNMILGLGETVDEVLEALQDLKEAGCELVTITQYLRPSTRHHPVDRWVEPQEFLDLAAAAREIGFSGVMAGPLVRSSYKARSLHAEAVSARRVQRNSHQPDSIARNQDTGGPEA